MKINQQYVLFKNKVLDKQKHNFTFIDLFSGIGGFRIPLEKNGCKAIGFSEIYLPAIETYKLNFDTKNDIELGDITKLQDIPHADLYVGGVPCQSWSVAGSKRGFNDPRGRLWFDTIRVTELGKPKAFIYENVKGLADPRNRSNLNLIISELNKIGYVVSYKVLNAFRFGQAQNRERVFIVGFRKDIFNGEFIFPSNLNYLPNLIDSLTDIQSNSINKTLVDPMVELNSFNLSSIYNKGKFFTFGDTRNGDNTIHSWEMIKTTDYEKQICLLILQNRRKSVYGKFDGNPMSLNDLKQLDRKVQIKDLDGLVEKGILKKIDNKYDFTNSKNSAGINNVYRVFLPSSHVFSTITRTGSKDFIATIDIPNNIKNRKEFFINEIFNKNKFRAIRVGEALNIQGFPIDYKFKVKDKSAMQLIGNAVPVKVVDALVKNILPLIK